MNTFIPKIIGFAINCISLITPKYAAHLAITLFSKPKKGKTKPNEADYLKDALQEEVIYNNTPIKTYTWAGNKDTILLAHGWESNTYRWKDLIEILKKLNYNIIALDAPAHGSSGGNLFNAIIYSESINVVAKKYRASVIIGHSVGGMSTVFSQYNHPIPSIKKLVLLGAPADFTGIFNRYTYMMGYSKLVAKAMNQYVYRRFNYFPDHFSAAKFSEKIKAKGLIIHDKKDRIIPYTDGLKFKKNYTNAEFISTKGFGHGLKSRAVYDHILEFLNA